MDALCVPNTGIEVMGSFPLPLLVTGLLAMGIILYVVYGHKKAKARTKSLFGILFVASVVAGSALLSPVTSSYAAPVGCTTSQTTPVSPGGTGNGGSQEQRSIIALDNVAESELTIMGATLSGVDPLTLEQELGMSGEFTASGTMEFPVLANDSTTGGATIDASTVDLDVNAPGVQYTVDRDGYRFVYNIETQIVTVSVIDAETTFRVLINQPYYDGMTYGEIQELNLTQDTIKADVSLPYSVKDITGELSSTAEIRFVTGVEFSMTVVSP